MAVAIRLRREGSLNHPYYKVVVADQRSPRDGKFIEIIGTYDPKKAGDNSTDRLGSRRLLGQVRRSSFGHRAQHHQEGAPLRPPRRERLIGVPSAPATPVAYR